MKKLFFYIMIIIFISGLSVNLYLYQSHSDISKMDVEFFGRSEILITKINNKSEFYNNKIVQINGIITDIDVEGIMINQQVYCQFSKKEFLKYSFIVEQKIVIKGRVIGFDNLFNQLKLDQSIVIED